jgi:glycosyltransferase involved in cell wall biosynthesis
MNVLLLEPWYGGSHRHFVDGIAAHSTTDVRTITLSARFWKWRMQGGAITLARKTEELLDSGFEPSVILASDMVNLPAYLALMRRRMGDVPVILYFHENQLTYPLPPDTPRDFTYAYINYLSCLTADRVLFNSKFHFDSFLDALPGLLKIFPDHNHLDNVQQIRDKSRVLHLGLDLRAHDAFEVEHVTRQNHPLVVLWNHRWEYDKAPDTFFRLMNRLDDAGANFRLILAGEHFDQQPPEFDRAFERYAERIIHYGYAEDFAEYSRLLHRADIVVSTAIHEFFGVAMLEAIYCGCHPVLPARLSYPEIIPRSLHQPLLHAPVLYDDPDGAFRLMMRLLNGEDKPLPAETLRGIAEHLDWSRQIVHYDDVIEEVAAVNMPG